MSAILRPERPGRLHAELACSRQDIIASQRLRYRIFAGELGARLSSTQEGIDEDRFDEHCHHLLVRDRDTGRIVASTRLLTDDAAARAGGFYSSTEFDLGAVAALPGRKLEVGRTCVDPAYRQGAAIAVLWAGLAGYIRISKIDYLFGCASIEMADGGLLAQAIMNRLRRHAFVREDRRVVPRVPLPVEGIADDTVFATLPPLLKAYVRLGARACGEACWDRDFGVADVFMLLDVDDLDPSYSRHFMARVAE